MYLIVYLYRQSKRLFLLATASSIVSGLAGAALIAVISRGTQASVDLTALAWLFFGVCTTFLVAKTYSEIALLHLTQITILQLRITLSRKLLATPLRKLQELDKHRLLAILTKDIDTFISAFQYVPHAFGNGVLALGCVGYMAVLSWQLVVMFAVTLFICTLAYHVAERKPRQQLFNVRDQLDALYGYFRDLIEGTKELQMDARRGEMFVARVIAPTAGRFKASYVRAMSRYTWVSNSGMVLFYVVIGILLFVIPHFQPQSVQTLMTATLIILFLVGPITETMFLLPLLRQAAVALSRIRQLDDVLEFPSEQNTTAPDPFLRQAPAYLELKGVCHQYARDDQSGEFTLGPIDLLIAEGELLYVTGGNGSGKTTLAMLILGLYEPQGGEITFRGTTVTQDNVQHYRQKFSAVFSDFHLFEHLLGDNEQELRARAGHYIQAFGMAEKVTVENGKFSALKLSTGQRKRLALVSSYLDDRPIYVFDEWAADQDPAFKAVFYTELLPELKARGKTVIVITHDDYYFASADRVIKLSDGRLQPIS